MNDLLEKTINHFPNGWYRLENSSRLKKNKIYTFNFFGMALIGIRTSSGSVNVFNAYCPHLGAHLGIGGRIKKDKLICPFHGWQYNSSGECIEIPYCKNIPKRAKLQSYPVKEIKSCIYIYYSMQTANNTVIEDQIKELPSFYCKEIFTTQMNYATLQNLIERAETKQCRFKSHGVGFFMANIQEFRLVMFVTPIDNKNLCVSFAVAKERLNNSFLVSILQKRRFKNMHTLLNILVS